MSRPNIVWICSDQQRSDSLGCTGNEQARTPNLNALAAAGTRFTRHITPCQICSPSRATMFTGLYPRHHQLAMNGMALDPELPTLPGILSTAGYQTHGVGKHHLQPILAPAELEMPDSRAFWQLPRSREWNGPYYGLDTVDLLIGEADTAAIAGHYANWLAQEHPDASALLAVESAPEPPPSDLDEIWRSAMPVELYYNTWITDCALRFLERTERPFFLFVSYPDPHHPFAPPADYADRYEPAQMPLPRADEGELDRMPPYYRELFPSGVGFRELYWKAPNDLEAGSMITTNGVSNATLRRAIAHTHAMVEMIDDGVGRILAALNARGLDDSTIVLFTSDHGELLGRHGLLHKGPPPYRQLVEVCLLTKGPGIPAGREVDALTNHIDLVPTFLEFAGVPTDGLKLDGASMVPLLNGGERWSRDANFGEYHPNARKEIYNQSIRMDRWRYTRYPNQPDWGELFDLNVDPDEHHNLYQDAAYASVIRELMTLLEERFPPQPAVDNVQIVRW